MCVGEKSALSRLPRHAAGSLPPSFILARHVSAAPICKRSPHPASSFFVGPAQLPDHPSGRLPSGCGMGRVTESCLRWPDVPVSGPCARVSISPLLLGERCIARSIKGSSCSSSPTAGSSAPLPAASHQPEGVSISPTLHAQSQAAVSVRAGCTGAQRFDLLA